MSWAQNQDGSPDAQARTGCVRVQQFVNYGLRRQHFIEEFRQKLDFTNQDEIADRRRVRDGDHRREASRIAAISRSRSSIV